MEQAVQAIEVTAGDRRISDTIERERRRLRNFIRTRVADIDDAEDIRFRRKKADQSGEHWLARPEVMIAGRGLRS